MKTTFLPLGPQVRSPRIYDYILHEGYLYTILGLHGLQVATKINKKDSFTHFIIDQNGKWACLYHAHKKYRRIWMECESSPELFKKCRYK